MASAIAFVTMVIGALTDRAGHVLRHIKSWLPPYFVRYQEKLVAHLIIPSFRSNSCAATRCSGVVSA